MTLRRPALGAAALALLTAAVLTGCGASSDSTDAAGTTAATTTSAAAATTVADDESIATPGAVLSEAPADEPLVEETAAPETTSPVETIAATDEPSIANTTWTGTAVWDGGYTATQDMGFNADGALTVLENGYAVPGISWSREGNTVTYTTEGGYFTATGPVDGDTIVLTGTNQGGRTAVITVTKQ